MSDGFMIGKQEVYDMLDRANIEYEVVEHEPVFTVEEALAAGIPQKGVMVKNLFLCDQKGRRFYLVTLPLTKRVSLAALAKCFGEKRLRFVSARRLPELIGVGQGSVTPFAVLNDRSRIVCLVLDKELVGKLIGVHPMENSATVYLPVGSVVSLVESYGSLVRFQVFPES